VDGLSTLTTALREQRTPEGLGAVGERDAGAVGVRVGELARQVADAVRADLRGDLERAEDAERLAVAVDEGAARVAGDAGRDGVDLVAPAVAGLAEAQALLRAQLREAEAERGVAVGQDLLALGDGVDDAGRTAPE